MISISGRLVVTALLFVAGAAHAQGSVTVYGIADAGMTWINNVGGRSQVKVDSGQAAASRLGFRGVEDLGGGLKAVFNLEAGLNLDTGATQSAAKFFNRASFVGLSSSQWGTLTLGRQVDFLHSDLPPDSVPILQGGMAAGWQSAAGQQLDIHYGPAVFDNTIKWKQQIGAVKFGLMYGMGNEVSNGPGREWMASTYATYEAGPLSIGVGYSKDNYVTAVTARQALGVRGLYKGNGYLVLANLGQGKDPRDKSKITSSEVAFMANITPQWSAGAGIGFASVTTKIGARAKLTQPTMATKYTLSRRTTLYAAMSSNHSNNTAAVAPTISAPGGASLPSTGRSQTGLRVGVMHTF